MRLIVMEFGRFMCGFWLVAAWWMCAVPTLAFCHSEMRVVVKGRSVVDGGFAMRVLRDCWGEIAEHVSVRVEPIAGDGEQAQTCAIEGLRLWIFLCRLVTCLGNAVFGGWKLVWVTKCFRALKSTVTLLVSVLPLPFRRARR